MSTESIAGRIGLTVDHRLVGIVGTARSGKTSLLHQIILDLARRGDSILLVANEHRTFEHRQWICDAATDMSQYLACANNITIVERPNLEPSNYSPHYDYLAWDGLLGSQDTVKLLPFSVSRSDGEAPCWILPVLVSPNDLQTTHDWVRTEGVHQFDRLIGVEPGVAGKCIVTDIKHRFGGPFLPFEYTVPNHG